MNTKDLLEVYLHQRKNKIENSVYKMTQCDFAYNSNHMEGSKLTLQQTRMIFEKNKISGENINVDDVTEAKNHFLAFDYILDHAEEKLSDKVFFDLHRILKTGTRQAENPMYTIGQYKIYENVIGYQDKATTKPEDVLEVMNHLVNCYENKPEHTAEEIIDFHEKFESVHPFSDGNGRVGRLVMFKECLRQNVTPFIITDDIREYYIRGLQNYQSEKGWLIDTCLSAQDTFQQKYMPLAQSYYAAMEKTRPSKQQNRDLEL